MLSDQDFDRRMWRTVLAVAATGIGLAALWAARDALMLIYVSALVAMGFSPLVRLIEHRRPETGAARVPRVLAILVIYLSVISLVVGVALVVLPPLVEQATEFWDRFPQHFNDIQRVLIRNRLLTRRVTLQEAVEGAPAGAGGNAVVTVMSALWSVTGGLLGLVTIVILSFYLLIEGTSLLEFATRLATTGHRRHVTGAARRAVDKVSAWLRAQITLGLVMGVCTAAGLAWLAVPYYYVIALVAAVGETIPMVGPIIAGVTAVIIAVSVSTRLALVTGLFFLALHQLEANVLVPKIMERRVGVSPVTVMVAFLIGGALWGLIGAILAVPTAAIVSVAIDEFWSGDERA